MTEVDRRLESATASFERAKAEYDRAASSYQTIRALTLGAVVLGILLAVLIGGAMIRQISRSLGEAMQITEAVARGDLTVPIHAQGKDVIEATGG